MMLAPRIGQRVQLWYCKSMRDTSAIIYGTHHGEFGTVLVVGRPKRILFVDEHGNPKPVVVQLRNGRTKLVTHDKAPRNHLIQLDSGITLCVPCGNLRKAKEKP